LVISGGEPLAYRSEGKGLLDAAEKHPDVLFMFYTNGTLIDEKTAQRIAALGNVTPAISVEGWRERTDERRGVGVFDKILAAMEQLRKAGVFFGISLTATRHNVEEILSEEFIDYFFEQQGAFYGWIFQYMPIGRSFTLDLMPTPEQRLWMWKRSWEIVKKRKIFLADFWNHGTLSNGCIAGGRARGGGYLYIDWNGHVSPCVFVPYYLDNVTTLYNSGKTLSDAMFSPLFVKGRAWQKEYIGGKYNPGNLLAPCYYRDHYKTFYENAQQCHVLPENEEADEAFHSSDYHDFMLEYDRKLEKLASPVWDELKMKHGKVSNEKVKL